MNARPTGVSLIPPMEGTRSGVCKDSLVAPCEQMRLRPFVKMFAGRGVGIPQRNDAGL